MKKKRNNKGFSLVELIVVMAIMAILAVTLAPRLMQYVDKARQANDREIINTMYTAVQYALADDKIYADVHDTDAATTDTVAGTDKAGKTFLNSSGDYVTTIDLKYGADGASTGTDNAYNVTSNGKVWTKTTYLNIQSNKFLNEIMQVIGDFKLQSKKATSNAKIIITIIGQDDYSISLDYDTTDGTASDLTSPTYDYVINSTDAS